MTLLTGVLMETITYDPKPLTANQLQRLSQEVKQALTELYGERLDQVILYGSYARGDFHAESDVNYLVVLRDEVVKHGGEIRFMGSHIGELSTNYDLFIAVKPVPMQKYRFSQLPFYQNVRREGIAL